MFHILNCKECLFEDSMQSLATPPPNERRTWMSHQASIKTFAKEIITATLNDNNIASNILPNFENSDYISLTSSRDNLNPYYTPSSNNVDIHTDRHSHVLATIGQVKI